MAATKLLSDNGVASGITGYQLTGGNDGTLQLQTTTAGGTATTAVTIDTSQNVGIGTSSPGSKLGVAWATNTGINLSDGTVTGVIYNTSGNSMGIGTTTNHPVLFFSNNTERMRINAGAPILCLSGGNTSATGTGIAFPATQSASTDANTLDDYEEGTWTPAIGGTANLSNAVGTYTKIGNLVQIVCHLTIVTIGTGSTTTISGLPFTARSDGLINTVNFGYFGGLSTALTFLTGYIAANSATVIFAGTSTAQATIGNAIAVMANGTDLYFTATYRTA